VGTRSYQQYCGLAAALDVVGQRWALLIVRDLVPGPRRFTDLFDGLPGISTDLLTDRLRSLEAAGAVRRREVRNPAPASLYELTERGFDLARLAGDLARWGSPLLPSPDEAAGLLTKASWTLQQRAARYAGGLPDGDIHITLDDSDELTISVSGQRCRLRYGHHGSDPLLEIHSSTESFLALLRNPTGDLDETTARLVGDTAVLKSLIDALAIRPQPDLQSNGSI